VSIETPPPFDRFIGVEYLEHGDDFARARLTITPELLQPYDIVHGGVHSALAESVVSRATAMLVAPRGKGAVGLSNHTSFLRPATAGVLHADGRARHRGRTTWVWDVDISDDSGRLCSTSRITLAVIDPPERPDAQSGDVQPA